MSKLIAPVRRALQRFNAFTLVTFYSGTYQNPYADQAHRPLSGPRVF
jgi:hypothetical protein